MGRGALQRGRTATCASSPLPSPPLAPSPLSPSQSSPFCTLGLPLLVVLTKADMLDSNALSRVQRRLKQEMTDLVFSISNYVFPYDGNQLLACQPATDMTAISIALQLLIFSELQGATCCGPPM